MTISASAPGKLIVMGEHAVVHGHRAVAIAVDQGTTVTLTPRDGPTALDEPWADDERLDSALLSVLPPDGVGVRIRSDLPIGRGMGSSAALAVALARARCAWDGTPPTHETIDALAFRVESIFHGTPSGIDHTVSMMGGAIGFQRVDGAPVYERLAIPSLPLVVIDSGAAGNTAALVARVRSRRDEISGVLDDIGHLVEAALPNLVSGDLNALGPQLTENHRLLRQLDVSTPTLDSLVDLALAHGALGAKLAGAGGGGVVIALCPEPEPLIRAGEAAGFPAAAVAIDSRS